ncbi:MULTISPECIES: glycosyltransferase family 2 protein [Microbacterium]|uniref:glycosyltransferase family 2 protein n=1 Tax=Microbacterium TaxID=33882 RepID=UPI00277F23E6|nr:MULTISPECIES: glycosyltransferase [Microbacterium]MDQ1075593.1 GT2 family glycosyltransferase [Microbacterium sp. SORGH_AS_0969]MDQ1115832.1 GT2 family glycosyltransferase [Microbacterium testaceum]
MSAPGWVVGNRWDDVADAPSRLARVSVIVTHYDQQAELDRTLLALSRQDYPAHLVEIVVADDGSPSAPIVPPGVRVVSQPDLGFRAAAARNRGVTASTGEILCFLDADTAPEPGYVRAMTRLPGLLPEAVTVGRRRHAALAGTDPSAPIAEIAPTVELPEPQWLLDAYARTENLRLSDDRSYRYIIGAVMACSRAMFDDVGGFDESFSSYGGEDWEWAHRAWQAGAVFAHIPDAVAWHDGPEWAERPGVDRAREGNAQTLTLADLIPVDGSSGRGLLPRTPDLAIHLDGEFAPAATFLCVDSVLEAFPRATVILDATPTVPVLTTDPRLVVGNIPDARVVLRLTQPVVVLDADELRERLARLGQGDEGRLIVRSADGTAIGEATSRRARRREERWHGAVGFTTGTVVTNGVLPVRDEPHLESWVGRWGGVERWT